MAGTANAVNGPEAAPYLAKSGGTMVGNLILNALPTTSLQAATKGYVDTIALNLITACLCASTTALTVTYSNGSSGVGATLTNAGAMAAFSVDGISPVVNDRVLIKNQASGLENGIYIVTTVGSGAVNWVLTRATDYDEASDMHAGDKVAIVSGTTQAATEWMMTQTAAITVGVTSITWAEMGNVTAAITSLATQIISATGTYTPSAGMIFCVVELVGGGGGAGGITGGTGGQGAIGGGGGGGGYCRKLFNATETGANAAVTIGAGGAGGASGGGTGGTGVSSVFNPAGTGATLTAAGGEGGIGMTESASTQIAEGGDGGVGTNGDLNIQGNCGRPALSLASAVGAFDGTGGSSYLSSSSFSIGQNGSGGGTGGAAGGYGCGATGRYSVAAGGTTGAGVAGADGVCIVTEFISTSA